MSHGLDRDGWPSADTVLSTERKQIADLKARLAEAEHDIDAYRGALGYTVPGDHNGRLSDGSTPRCGICEALAARLAAQQDLCLPPFGHAFTVPHDRMDERFLAWLRQNCVIVTEAEYAGLRDQLAAAERERDKALVKADTLQFLMNQREIDIHGLRELLREARPFVYALTRNDDLRDRIDAALERT